MLSSLPTMTIIDSATLPPPVVVTAGRKPRG
jgi:hypothetical protein